MTRDELVAALRERFARLHAERYPEAVEAMRTVSDYSFLSSHARCGACKKLHLTTDTLVELAARCHDTDEWLGEMQRLALSTYPRPCIKHLERFSAELAAARKGN